MIGMQTKRILVGGAKNFVRGGAVSGATVLIMTVTLMILGFLMFVSALLSHTLTSIQDKVDVNIYFITTAEEPAIFALKDKLELLPEVARVDYTSRDDAFLLFQERHKDDQLTLQALEELGENPLGASLAVKAKTPEQYESIVNFLGTTGGAYSADNSGGIIDRINYFQNKTVIERLTKAIRTTERAGLLIVLLFSVASIIICYATIRLAIYTARDEIAVMRLVGANNMYIRGPFIVTGIMSGALAGIVTLLVFYPVSYFTSSKIASWLDGFSIFSYYLSHFPQFFLYLVGAGIVLGSVSSYFAVRKYLKV